MSTVSQQKLFPDFDPMSSHVSDNSFDWREQNEASVPFSLGELKTKRSKEQVVPPALILIDQQQTCSFYISYFCFCFIISTSGCRLGRD